MNSWCESCARKNLCYVVDDRPKCFVPITNTASGTPYLVGISLISRDNHEIAKDEPQSVRSNLEPFRVDEPQTDTEIARAIVHKMIDDAVIAEDAYPDLRKRMHDTVDNYEPQTERSE